MKKLALPIIAVLLLLVGCMGAMRPYTKDMVIVAEEKTVGIGDVFFDHEEGVESENEDPFMGRIKTGGFKYDLTILELTNDKIGLQYNEFTYNHGSGNPLSPFGMNPQPYVPAGWLVKQGFNKRFDYSVADKVIRFKGYEFEILSVEKGQLKYRRVK